MGLPGDCWCSPEHAHALLVRDVGEDESLRDAGAVRPSFIEHSATLSEAPAH